MKKFFLLFAFLLSFNVILAAEEQGVTTITITHARRTTYKQDEATKNDMIELEGSVQVVVQKGSTSTEIKADRVTYDRKTEMLYAEGNVEILTKSSSSGGESSTADSLLMNTATLEGVFDGGRVVQTKSDSLNLPSGSTLIVFSDVFGKSESNTIAFKNSSLTFCDDEDPHWHIDATRTWLLPGGEFAFFNALLYVGKLPVLYLPAFYYPKDELLFNPVFGKRDREGYYIQTTSYLYGRKPLDTSSSSSSSSSSSDSTSAEALKGLYNFMKPTSLKMQERQGLILHNLDEDFTGSTSNYIKLLADAYSNLGYMVGVDGVLQPSKTYLTSLKFYLNIGFSNTVFYNSGVYSSISSKGKSYWDSSNFLGMDLPFRYAGNVDLTLSKPFSLSLNLPLYSDPFFSNDFKDRSETMDWISYLLSQSSSDEETSTSSVSSFIWKLTSSYSLSIPAVIKPYISSLSMNYTSSLNFSSTTTAITVEKYKDKNANGDSWTSYTPERQFYYPSQITPGTLSFSLAGTLFEYSNSKTQKTYTKPSFKISLTKPDELKSEKELKKEKEELEKKLAEEAAKKEAEAKSEESLSEENSESGLSEAENSDNNELTENSVNSESDKSDSDKIEFVKAELPELTSDSLSTSTFSGLNYKLAYSLAPTLTTQISYSTTDSSGTTYLKTPEDFEWSKINSFYYNVKFPLSLNSNLSYGGSFISLTNKVAWNPIWQGHPNMDGLSETKQDANTLADYKAQSQTITGTNTLSFKPFTYIDLLSDTSISYNNTLKLFRYEFIGDADNKEYEKLWFWDYWSDDTEDEDKDDYITAHSITATLALKEQNSKFKQTFSYTATLPPQVQKHSFSANFVFPYVTAAFSTSVQETSLTDSTQYWNPFQQSLTFTMPDISNHFYFGEGFFQKQGAAFLNSFGTLKLTESYNVNLKEWESRTEDADNIFSKLNAASDSFKLSLNWQKFTASYVMSYTTPYELDMSQGWIAKSEKDFLPYTFSFSYKPTFDTIYKWKNRVTLSPGLSTSITADLVRPTNSYFLITPSLTFKINSFFDLTFSSTSRNSTMYWYFQDDGIYSDDYYGNNFLSRIFMDLLQSFGFYGINGSGADNFEKNRQSSGFKLKTLSMTASHKLHDWSFNLTWKFEPKIVTEDGEKSYNYNPYITIGIVWNPMESIKTKIVDDYGEWSLE
ncbi:MAG: hypothetical protein K5829_10300 [Treponema sp.]|nr:hypothetical protein [Treponema sp.]